MTGCDLGVLTCTLQHSRKAQLAKECHFQPCSSRTWGRWWVCPALLSPGKQEKLPPAWSHYHLGCYQEAWQISGNSHNTRKDNWLKIVPYLHGSPQSLKRNKIKAGTVISSFFHPHSVFFKHVLWCIIRIRVSFMGPAHGVAMASDWFSWSEPQEDNQGLCWLSDVTHSGGMQLGWPSWEAVCVSKPTLSDRWLYHP